ncbi:MAG: tetratricopeptide repeat protein [Candidatus Omnitrophica bacterium]|nr:tetratricopeptide repeat protein [Candidatus Omnitrophota bacterium]
MSLTIHTQQRRQQWVAAVALAAFTWGCSANYNGERLFWKAQQFHSSLTKEGQPSPEQVGSVIAAFNRVIEKAPGTMWAARSYLVIGSLHATQKRFEEARQAYQLILQNYNQYKELSLDARLAIAKTYEAENNWNKAVKSYYDLTDYYPWSRTGLEAPLYIAAMDEKRQEREAATKAYQTAVRHYTKLMPDAPNPELANQAKSYLALAYQRLGEWEQAIGVLEELSVSLPEANRPLVLLTLASIYQMKLGSATKAEEIYTKLIQEFPDHPMGKVAKAQLASLGVGQPAAQPAATGQPPLETPASRAPVTSAPSAAGRPNP